MSGELGGPGGPGDLFERSAQDFVSDERAIGAICRSGRVKVLAVLVPAASPRGNVLDG
jgi:hypothetical protein